MPHVGVQSLGAGDHQENGAQHHESLNLIEDQEFERIPGENGGEHPRRVHHLHYPGHRQKAQPDQDHRPEQAAHPRRAMALEQKKADQNGHGERNYVGVEYRRGYADTFHRAQNGYGRGDHPVTEQKTGREEAQADYTHSLADIIGSFGPAYQGGQGDDAALTMIVRPENEDEVLESHDHDQGPEDQRQDAQDVGLGHRDAVFAVKAFPYRIYGAGGDITEYHP